VRQQGHARKGAAIMLDQLGDIDRLAESADAAADAVILSK
jgi:hypothetical protein